MTIHTKNEDNAGDKTVVNGVHATSSAHSEEGAGTSDNSQGFSSNGHTDSEGSSFEGSVDKPELEDNNTSEAKGDEQPDAAIDSTDENESVSVKEGTYAENGTMIANFSLFVLMILNKIDCGKLIKQVYKMMVCLKGKEYSFDLSAADFSAGNFMPAVDRVVPNAILHKSSKELLIAVKKTITEKTPTEEVSLRTGFTPDYNEFLLPRMRITSKGITSQDEQVVDPSGGNLIRNVNFLRLEADKIKFLLIHLIFTFASLKSKKVMFLVLGHVALAPFASWIVNEIGRQKYALHLKGPSGGGKTFIARLVGSFFGTFGEQLTSWSSTANSIEAEGFFFRDMIYILDDLKTSVVSQKEIIRVIQNHADNRGRSRLNSSLQLLQPPHISGLLLSTGENFVENVESVSARTIAVEVESEIDEKVGEECKEMQDQYKGFIPMFVQWMISRSTWQEDFKRRVNERISEFSSQVTGIPNGYRMATNLSLNAVAFEYFFDFAVEIGAIDVTCYEQLMAEYNCIIQEHQKVHKAALKAQNPADQCFSLLSRLLATRTVIIDGLFTPAPNAGSDDNEKTINKDKLPSEEEVCIIGSGKIIGKLSSDKGKVYIFPDLLIDRLNRNSSGINQPVRFDKESLRASFIKDSLINLQKGRYSQQIRYNDVRLQAWQFDLDNFKKRCIDVDGE